METPATPVTTSSVGIRYGLLLGLVSVIFSFLQLTFIEDPETPLRWLSVIILIGGIVLAHKHFKQQNQGFMAYGQGLAIGTIVSAVSGIIGGVFTYIYFTFIDPSYMARVMELTRSRMEEKGMPDAQIDQAMAWSEKFTTGPISMIFPILGALLMGFLISLVVSAFTKNSRPEFE
ncbi:DUF4199 domain-containing protein [Hymenobacter sp. BT186]|uniref:DUF4199 domain-containing protein n=1 Tax=Hymenobacter telluris TaxID=2816474 RepID=A0A939F284_9BACT|nr:DUF4199 domain-containing protein [Hymenobacter telluris]MBO0360053.1 DUF4199 domain-containing protein [Hymenobacter telluris]MBW3376080.1 DUF4199 domain-containing protein [Hymenobacter norwichensis]